MTTLAEQKRELVDRWRKEGAAPMLLKAFQAVPREEFMPDHLKSCAYLDQPYPIGHEQTISQPTTIMIMLGLLEMTRGQSVLEIGAGSGYVCALLAEFGCQVTGIEIVPELAVSAAKTLEDHGYGDRVALHAGDGSGGWEHNAPYDRILVSAAFQEVPAHLLEQVKEGGILVAPVGAVEQRMIVCRKKKGGEIVQEDHGAFIFVPITGKHGIDNDRDVPMMPFM